MTIVNFIHYLSIFSILIPITAGARRWNWQPRERKAFLLFLLFGLGVDIGLYGLVGLGRIPLAGKIFNLYSLAESVLFLYFIGIYSKKSGFSQICRAMLFLVPLYWLVLMFVQIAHTAELALINRFFDPVYQVAAAFMAGFAILYQLEQLPKPLRHPEVWILTGIFFYCFCTFFIIGMIETFVSQNLWYIHNLFNITSYGFYGAGFLLSRPPNNL